MNVAQSHRQKLASLLSRWRWTVPCPRSPQEIYNSLWSDALQALLKQGGSQERYLGYLDSLLLTKPAFARQTFLNLQFGECYVVLRNLEGMQLLNIEESDLVVPRLMPYFSEIVEWGKQAMKMEESIEFVLNGATRSKLNEVIIPTHGLTVGAFIEGARLLPQQEDHYPVAWVV